MTDKHYVDAEKLLEWAKVGLGSAKLYMKLASEIESGRIDPDPPQQPYIQIGDWVRHKSIDRGVGRVMGFFEGLINVQFPNVYASCFEENLQKVRGKEA